MARPKKNKKQEEKKINENKVELAKTIAQQSQKIARSYASIENTMAKGFRWVSSWFDKILFNQRYAKEVALILAIILYVATNSTDSLSINKPMAYTYTYENQPVTAEVNSAVYEVTGLPDAVTVYLMGELSDVQMADSQATQKVVADLNGLGEGTHQVDLKVANISNRITAVVEPSNAVITISKKQSQEFQIGYDFINTKDMDSVYALSAPEFEKDSVLVRASDATIRSISIVKALIDVSNVTGDFTVEAPLVAYDQLGNRMDVDIVPDKIKTTVKVTRPEKDVPISIVPIGEIPNNKAISRYSLDHQAVTIYGPQEVLDQINGIDIQVPVSSFTSSPQVLSMPINLPSGVRKKSVSVVSITIELADKVEKVIEEIPIQWKNNTQNYKLTLDENEPQTVNVTVSGAQEILDSESGSGISVYIDLADVTQTGTIELPLHVSGGNKLATYTLDKQTIKINVAK